jgi:hypothetical protein
MLCSPSDSCSQRIALTPARKPGRIFAICAMTLASLDAIRILPIAELRAISDVPWSSQPTRGISAEARNVRPGKEHGVLFCAARS